MSTQISTHPPAVKVGGRRLSITKPKHSTHSVSMPETLSGPDPPTDYPRPTAGGSHKDSHYQQQEEQTKRDKRKRVDQDHVVKRDAKWTENETNKKKSSYGASGRISQPAGKGIAA